MISSANLEGSLSQVHAQEWVGRKKEKKSLKL